MIENIIVGIESPIGEPIFTAELPDVIDGNQFGGFWRQRQHDHVNRDLKGA